MFYTKAAWRLASIAAAALVPAGVLAACASDTSLKELQARVAGRHFPELLPRLPRIEMCDSPLDMPGAAGEFRHHPERIRILRGSGIPTEVVVAHELGHAVVHRLGLENRRFGGHGAEWLRIMIRAGYADEAARAAGMVDHYPGLRGVHARVVRAEKSAGVTSPPINLVALLAEKPDWLPWMAKKVD